MPIGRLKLLYLLALFQLISGPLILLQVVVLSHQVVRDAPTEGWGCAFHQAWKSTELQTTFEPGGPVAKHGRDDQSPGPDPTLKPVKGKMPMVGWEENSLCAFAATGRIAYSDWARRWTPVWPQAPPGPPPRVG